MPETILYLKNTETKEVKQFYVSREKGRKDYQKTNELKNWEKSTQKEFIAIKPKASKIVTK